eukprot:767212-Hanusia_phi.AAC.1
MSASSQCASQEVMASSIRVQSNIRRPSVPLPFLTHSTLRLDKLKGGVASLRKPSSRTYEKFFPTHTHPILGVGVLPVMIEGYGSASRGRRERCREEEKNRRRVQRFPERANGRSKRTRGVITENRREKRVAS